MEEKKKKINIFQIILNSFILYTIFFAIINIFMFICGIIVVYLMGITNFSEISKCEPYPGKWKYHVVAPYAICKFNNWMQE